MSDSSEHVARLAQPFLTLEPNAPQIRHWVKHDRYHGQDCLSMAEREFGRALAMHENLFRLDGQVCRIGLNPGELVPEIWDVITPNADKSECHYRIHTEADPWYVRQVVKGAGNSNREVISPWLAWADLAAAPKWDPQSGEFANLAAWNQVRYRAGKPPMVADPSDDKHIYLLQLALKMRFGIFRTKGIEIHPAALREMTTGYTRERAEWVPEGLWVANRPAGPDYDPLGNEDGEAATVGSVPPGYDPLA